MVAKIMSSSASGSPAQTGGQQSARIRSQAERIKLFVLVRVLFNYLERVDRKLLDVAKQVSLFGRERVMCSLYVSNIIC